MSLDAIFWTQICSIIAFIIAIFTPYKVLVSSKDATIQLLNEKIGFLNSKIATLEESTPDALIKRLNDRINILNSELERLTLDKENHAKEIQEKTSLLNAAKVSVERYNKQLSSASLLLSDFFCPHCGDPIVKSETVTIYGSNDGDEADLSYVEYGCGFAKLDNEQKGECKNTHNNLSQSV